MPWKRCLFIILVFLIGLAGCVDFDTYSDSNEVIGLHAGVLSSDDVYVDKQEIISSTEGRIVLRLKGRLEESLPLTIDAEFELSPESKILYSEKYKQFVFHSVQDSFSFQVIAQSGLPKKWTISLQDARSNAGDIVGFQVKSWEANGELKDLITDPARLYKLKDTSLVEVFLNTTSDSIFPLKITPKIQLSEFGQLFDFAEGQSLVFENLQSVCHIKVEAENKLVKTWRIALRTPDSEDVNLKGGSFIVFSDCLEVSHMQFEIDTTKADALVRVDQVKDWKNFSVLLQYNMNLPLGARLELMEEESEDFNKSKVIFDRIEEVRKFKVVSQSGKEKIWKMKLGYNYDTKASIENFSISSYRPQGTVNVFVDPLAVDTARRVISVLVNTGVKTISESHPLYILPLLKLTDKSSLDGLEPDLGGIYHLPEIAFTSMTDVYRFSIFSESRYEYEWKIVLVDKQKEKDGSAEVKNVVLHSDKLPENVTFSDNIFTANSAEREIVLKLNTVKFPFILDGSAYTVNVSDKAKLMEAGQSFVFDDVRDHKTLRVEAENGTEKVWTLRLDYTRNQGADIKSMKISQVFPESVSFEKTAIIDTENAEVVISVTDANNCFPLRIDVETTLSEHAKLETELKNVVFANENALVKVHVLAESGIEREWTVRLKNQSMKSDEALITQFMAESIIPGIEIGTPVVDGTNIRIPVLAGKNQFPLSVDIDASILSEGATKSKVILTFENIGRTDIFEVKSQSGKVTTRYTVSLLNQIPLSNAAEITSLKLERYLPLSYQLPGSIEIEEGKVLVLMYGDMGQSLVLWPEIKVSEGAKLQGGIPVDGIEFSSVAQTKEIVVVAEDGTQKKWLLGVKSVPRPLYNEAVIEQVEGKTSDNIAVQPVLKENNNVVLYLGNAEPKYPFSVETTLSVSPNSKVVVNQNAPVTRKVLSTRATEKMKVVQVVTLTFNSPDDKIQVKVISEDETKDNAYSFALGGVKIKNEEANVVEYKVTSYFPMNMEEAPIVFAPDTAAGIITVNAPGEDVFPFTIYTKVRLSDKATLKRLDANSMTFEKGFTGQDFEVISESGRIKKWRLEMKVAEKSKENSVTSFEIKEYSPLADGLGRPEIRSGDRKIVIPVADWVKGERLNITAGIEISPKATTDFRQALFFQTAKDEYTFNVTAQNGDVAEWTVVLDYDYSDQADITSFLVTAAEPSAVSWEPRGVIDPATSTVYVDVIENLTFPFILTADIAFSAKSEADLSALSNSRIRFDRYQDSTVIRVTAEDEVTRKDWKVKLRYHFSDEADITGFSIISSQPSTVVLGTPAIEIVPDQHLVRVNVAEWNGQTNLQIAPALTVSDKATHNLSGDLLFVKKTSESKVINVMAESGKVTPWTVALNYEENSDAAIVAVNYSSFEPSNIDFLGASIDAKNGVVTFEFLNWQGSKTFTVKGIACQLSPKATSNIPEEMTFTKLIQESLDYVVKAQDGTERKWTFKVVYSESSAAEITRFRVTGNSQPGVISMATEGVIGDGTVDIDLNSGVRDAFAAGFQINVEVETSAKSTNDIPAVLSFSKATDVRKYTVTAESGVKKEWSVRFVNKASGEANILSVRNIAINNTPDADLKVAGWDLVGNDLYVNLTDVIYMNKYNSVWPTVNVNFNLELSDKAAVDGTTTKSVKVDAVKNSTLKVVADNGVGMNTYNIVFTYKPQLDNANLDTWRQESFPIPGASNSVWCTANNSMAVGTVVGAGRSGNAAVITTKTGVMLVNVAAGTLFIGRFKMDIGAATSDPRSMTHFGVPFPVAPKRIKFDAKYVVGSGTLKDGSRDKAHIWAEVDYWPTPNKVATDDSYNAQKDSNVKKYAYGEVILTDDVSSWTTFTIDLNVTNPNVTPTNLLFVASSSKNGDSFDGCNGSQLMIDNVELIYE